MDDNFIKSWLLGTCACNILNDFNKALLLYADIYNICFQEKHCWIVSQISYFFLRNIIFT
jgi:hypothetical protein